MCELPRAEALHLAGGRGPLAAHRLPGVITVSEGDDLLSGHRAVLLDQRAFRSLAHLGCLGETDGRIVYEGDLPVLETGGGRYEVRPGGRRDGRDTPPPVPGAG